MAITSEQVASAMWPQAKARFVAILREMFDLPSDWNPSDESVLAAMADLARTAPEGE